MARQKQQLEDFEAQPATMENVPLLIGLEGPPGGGKTFSALRLATGIQRHRGGNIHVIDTEGGRSRKYADRFKFHVVEMKPPFRSKRFKAAIEAQLKHNPACIIVDNLSDEHDGIGGLLDFQKEELNRLTGGDMSKAGAVNQAAWIEPKNQRNEFANSLSQMANANGIKPVIIFNFRAREKTDIKTSPNGRTKIEKIGFVPIAPNDILHQLDLVCLLPPRADGVPRWRSDKIEEGLITKLPEFLRPFLDVDNPKALDERMGEAFSKWAMGGERILPPPGQAAAAAAASAQSESRQKTKREELFDRARDKARQGRKAWLPWKDRLTERQSEALDEIWPELEGLLNEADKPASTELPSLEHEGTP